MLTGSKAIKERKIFEYLSNIDGNNLSIDTIKKDLGILLGITPAIEIEWLPTKILVEGKIEKHDQPVMINIFWSDSLDESDFCITKFYIS